MLILPSLTTAATVRRVAVDWTRNGPELLLGLDRSAGTPLAHQLQERLRDAIRSGRLERGERLPASRALAAQLGVSRGVVVDTYAQLESEGYLRSAQGSGTVVASSGGDVRPAEQQLRPVPRPVDGHSDPRPRHGDDGSAERPRLPRNVGLFS